ncbi:membrane protein [Marinomonas sp. MED121]|uniref:DMT family transporter n=1 Tax=Marinomonas sp. MED121 TaxID=314277 RepID=UPI0000690D4E|nr:DMT family transporter [Marinomonas sp. MED121]EAQ65289.1 membrane protein [Marinomonas sp. MED121]
MTGLSARTAFFILFSVAFIWGAEFVLVDLAVAKVSTNLFNALRFALASLALLPLYFIKKEMIDKDALGRLFLAGFSLGFLLFIGFYAQTEGMRFTSVANAGFITGLSVPLVPVLAFLVFRQSASWHVWLGVIFATFGLYLLTIGDKLSFNQGDSLVLICAFAFHILLTDKFVVNLPIISLSIIQMAAVAIYSLIALALAPELISQKAMSSSFDISILLDPIVLSGILITGLLGSAYAYWAQSACQRHLEPAKVALIFATEPVFAFLSAWVFLGEVLGVKGSLGALLILVAILVSELGHNLTDKSLFKSIRGQKPN